MRIGKFLGRNLCFENGLRVGFNWVHCNGRTSKRSAVLASYHPPRSITWLWKVSWNKPGKFLCLPKIVRRRKIGYTAITLPFVGSLLLHRQPAMWRESQARG